LKLGVTIGPTNRKKVYLFTVLWSQIQIRDHFSISLTIAEWGITFLIQSPADFYNTWRNDWHQQQNESTTGTFWD